MKYVSRFLILSAVLPVLPAQPQGGFGPTSHLSTERMGHTATLLNNGDVLVAGGWAILAGWPVWASAELYNPHAGGFVLTASMSTPRANHTATLLPDGKVLIAGGYASSTNGMPSDGLATAELYDPSTNTFTATGPMIAGRRGHTATMLHSGKVLITGGIGQSVLSSAELYDPLTGTFSATGSMAAGRDAPVAVLLGNGSVLVEGGGMCESTPNPELYNPATGLFTLTGPSAYPASTGLAAVAASLLSNGNVLTTLELGCDIYSGAELYDSSSGTFAATGKMTKSFGYNTATLLPNGSVLIAGRDYSDQPGGSAQLYNPVAGAFTAVPQGLSALSEEGHTATLLSDGSVLVSGGWMCCGFSLATAEIYQSAASAPAPVLYSLQGGTQGAILHSVTHGIVSPENPAIAGEVLEVYGAGLIDGGAIPPQVAIGGRLAEVLYFGKAPGYPGLNQINVRVPSGVTTGTAVPVRLNYLARPSNEVTIGLR